jgi:enoyl-CoA hydratase
MATDRSTEVQRVTVDGVAWVTVARPEKLNALDRHTIGAIDGAVQQALADDAVRVLVLTGAGEKAFVAGADIAEMATFDPPAAQAFSIEFQTALDRLEHAGKPTLAAVNGLALGGGCELALACHLRIAADSARFGQPEINLGLIPGAGGTQRLPRLVGRAVALELILSGRAIDAPEALRIGLVQRVVPRERLRDEVQEYARQLATKSPLALARALEATLRGAECPQAEGLRLEAALFGLCFGTADMREGVRAFLEKRKPTFHGR